MSISTGSNGYDEVLQLFDGQTFDETNTTGDTLTGTDPLTVGKDYQVVKVVARLLMASEETDQTGNSDPALVPNGVAVARHQLSIRGSYAKTGDDGEVPAGVVFDEATFCQSPGSWKDSTNGAGGSWTGVPTNETVEYDVEDIPTWSGSLEEGSTIQMNWMVEGINDAQNQLYTSVDLYVKEQ